MPRSPRGAAAAPQQRKHPSMSIADALQVPAGTRVSIFAAVCEIRLSFRSRGSDYTCTLRIADQSCPFGISATFFAKAANLLPYVKSSRDVISLHRFKIMTHEDSLFLMFDKKGSSFAVFEGKPFGKHIPYRTSFNYCGSKDDIEALVQMRIWAAHNPIGLKHLELKLRSLKSDSTFDLVCKVFYVHENSGTHIYYVWDGTDTPPAEFQEMSDCRTYNSRIANRVHRQPMTSFPEACNATAVGYEAAGYSTLMESVTHNEVTHKLKTLVRVVEAYPCRASDLCLLELGKFCLRLTLEDPTARIHAYIHKDDAVKFFGGPLTEEALIKKMKKLLGVPEDSEEGAPLTRNPPWIWCCLKSYYLDEKDHWGSRRYRIFDTEMRG